MKEGKEERKKKKEEKKTSLPVLGILSFQGSTLSRTHSSHSYSVYAI
jgi:hypothetical protein